MKEKFKSKNSDLIKSFINIMGIREDYEVWAPYQYRGVLGFIDLLTKTKSKISIFKFVRDGSNLEEAIKSLKLEEKIYPKSKKSDKKIETYLVITDNDKNRKSIISLDPLLQEQNFRILLLDKKRNRVESYFESKYSIRQLFKSEDMNITKEGIKHLISKRNHKEIENAMLNMKDTPKEIKKGLVKKVDQYIRKNNKAPENMESLKRSEEKSKSYKSHHDNIKVKETEQSF